MQELALLNERESSAEELGDAEKLLLQLDSIPMFRSKLRLMHGMSSFDAVTLQRAAESYANACIELCESPSLLKLLSVVISHADFVNSGRGVAMQASLTHLNESSFLIFSMVSGLPFDLTFKVCRMQVSYLCARPPYFMFTMTT